MSSLQSSICCSGPPGARPRRGNKVRARLSFTVGPAFGSQSKRRFSAEVPHLQVARAPISGSRQQETDARRNPRQSRQASRPADEDHVQRRRRLALLVNLAPRPRRNSIVPRFVARRLGLGQARSNPGPSPMPCRRRPRFAPACRSVSTYMTRKRTEVVGHFRVWLWQRARKKSSDFSLSSSKGFGVQARRYAASPRHEPFARRARRVRSMWTYGRCHGMSKGRSPVSEKSSSCTIRYGALASPTDRGKSGGRLH